MRNPVDQIGILPTFHTIFGDRYLGNLNSNLLVPWVGIQIQESRLKGSFRFSPLAYTDIKMPFNYDFVASQATHVQEQERYTFRHSGVWLEGNLSYDIYKTSSWRCSLWTKADWLRTSGITGSTYRSDLYTNGTLTSTLLTDASSGSGSYHVSTYAFGIRVTY